MNIHVHLHGPITIHCEGSDRASLLVILAAIKRQELNIIMKVEERLQQSDQKVEALTAEVTKFGEKINNVENAVKQAKTELRDAIASGAQLTPEQEAAFNAFDAKMDAALEKARAANADADDPSDTEPDAPTGTTEPPAQTEP